MRKFAFAIAGVVAVFLLVGTGWFFLHKSDQDRIDDFLKKISALEARAEREILQKVAGDQSFDIMEDLVSMNEEEVRKFGEEKIPEATIAFDKISSELQSLRAETPEGIPVETARALRKYCEIVFMESKVFLELGEARFKCLKEYPHKGYDEAYQRIVDLIKQKIELIELKVLLLDEIGLLKRSK